MKNGLFFLLASFAILAYTGCNKDDDDALRSEFVLNGTTYSLAKGFIEDYGANGNGSFDFDVTLTSSGVNYSEAQGTFSGMGDFVYLDLNSSLETGLVAGTYNFSSDRNAFTIVDGAIGTDYDLNLGTGEDFTVNGGSVEVELIGNETRFSWSLNISNGTIVTGDFQGILRPI